MWLRLAVLAATCVLIVPAQSGAPLPKWEAISIKPCASTESGGGAQGLGRMTWSCVTVDILIHQSYLLMESGRMDLSRALMPVENVPDWATSDRFTIEAKAEDVPGQPAPGRGIMMGPMLRALLSARFKLKTHTEERRGPVYALTVLRSDSGVQRTKAGSCAVLDADNARPAAAPDRGLLPICGFPPTDASGFHGVAMVQFCGFLSQRTDRRVIDKTGLQGLFDIPIAWAYALAPPPPPPPAGNRSAGPTAAPPPRPMPQDAADAGERTAIIQENLRKVGLKLEATQGPEEILVIDRVEKPTGN